MLYHERTDVKEYYLIMVTKEGDGYLGALSERQQLLLTQLKETINKQNAETWKYDLAQFDDYDYLRFLRARKFDLKETLKMFTKYIKWRIDFEVDRIFVSTFCCLLNSLAR